MSQAATKSRQRRSCTGCMNCRRKKKKCDEGKPTCRGCAKTSEKCIWARPLRFLPQNAFTIENAEAHSPSISNLNESADDHNLSSDYGRTTEEEITAVDFDETINVPIQEHRYSFRERVDPSPESPHRGALSRPTVSADARISSSLSPALARNFTSDDHYSVDHNLDPRDGRSYFGDEGETDLSMNDTSATNIAFRNLCDPSIFIPSLGNPSQSATSPDVLTDDGIFLPGSTYQELHATLRQHVFSTARSREASRQQSPSPTPNDRRAASAQLTGSNFNFPEGCVGVDKNDVTLSAVEEYILWKNWVEEIADWLDKFDTNRHFARTLPTMAQTCSHLKYSMLALSARQLERKNKSIPPPLTLSLYSAAVQQLIPQLYRRDTYVLASCVINCVLEMMSCSPRAWRRHLDGCACLIRSMNIHADSSGIERALFWCFIRMDVCGGLISREPTLIPVDEWTSQPTFEHAINFFSSEMTVDSSAGFSCYLLSCVLNLLFDAPSSGDLQAPDIQHRRTTSYTASWKQLFAIIEKWYDTRSPSMLPIVTQSPSKSHPFPVILFGGGAAISGNQLHHTAAMMMLQSIPRNIRLPQSRSILWHARRICGITICNDHHGCWTNSVQPLWLAGQVMSHQTEHQAIIDIYARIEKETGWGATWRADDLKQFWGTEE